MNKHQLWKIAGSALLIVPVSAQVTLANDPPSALQDVAIEQIDAGEKQQSNAPVAQVAQPAKQKSLGDTVAQIPDDATALDDNDAPETRIVDTAPIPESRLLYNRVAEVWSSIRQRGQQPTPELIAREIGPDSLTNFLNAFPSASGIFGLDSDTMPLDLPGTKEAGADIFQVRIVVPPGP